MLPLPQSVRVSLSLSVFVSDAGSVYLSPQGPQIALSSPKINSACISYPAVAQSPHFSHLWPKQKLASSGILGVAWRGWGTGCSLLPK